MKKGFLNMLKKDYSAKEAMMQEVEADHWPRTGFSAKQKQTMWAQYMLPAKSNEDKGYKHMKTNMDSPILMSILVPLLFLDMLHNEQNFPMLF